MILDLTTFASPVGPLTLIAHGDRLVGLEFNDREPRLEDLRARLERRFGAFETREFNDPAGAASRLRAYFGGDLAALDAQAVELEGTAFQKEVWNALRDIRAGKTESYGALATRIGKPKAMRAVGAANGSNPVAIVVPCHRVIAADGTLHGYGGGLERKAWLLAHEHAILGADGGKGRARPATTASRRQTELFKSRIEPAAV